MVKKVVKKKVKKNIAQGICHIQASFNNLVASIDSLFQCHLLFNSFILSIVV